MKNCVYRFINVDDEIIYIGKAKNIESRLNNHNHLPKSCYNEMAYIEFTSFSNEHEMDFAERYYIQRVNPKYNTQLSSRVISFTSNELDNKEFKVYLVNEKVIEQCKYQMEMIKNEVDSTGVIRRICNHSIYDVTSYIFMKYNSEYRKYNKENLHLFRESIGEKSKFDFIQNVIRPVFADIRKEFSSRYNMLNISLVQYAPELLCSEKIDYLKNTVSMSLIVAEKYTSTKIAIPIILECKQ